MNLKDKNMNYDNFFLPAEDFQKSKQFFAEVLGLETKFDFSQMGMIAFKVGNEEPAIILKDRSKFPNVKPTIWIEVDDVKKTYEELHKKGVEFLTPPFPIKTGWAVEFLDPSGNMLGFTDYRSEH
ncbi:VOC family protein [Capnocytophaga sp.]|uniref:VOC family protein n=1 Tax=Capnocytophaga sp. TaxID=44737 RepID=UPI0026DA7542|nr:VOC family protein [Capnocytophaga sp.]MDO5104990.1 VOC family protein [Capnocytophaga sp.]